VDILKMEPAELRKVLIRLGGLDLDALDKAIADAKDIERQADREQVAALARSRDLPWHEDAPEEETSAAELSQRLQDAIAENAKRAAALAQQLQDAIAENAMRDRQATNFREAHRDIKEKIEKLPTSVDEQLYAPLLSHLSNQSDALLASKVDTAPLQPEFASKVDTAQLEAALANVEANNRKFSDNQARAKANAEWKKAEDELGKAIEIRKAAEAAKRTAIAAASFPVDGLGFDEKEVTFNGIPFSQAGNAERIRVAVAICLAGRGALPFLLIDNAEALDNKSLRLLIEEVDRQGAQCLAFVVANQDEDETFDRECAFYIVDGKVTRAPSQPEPTRTEGGAE
jgi:hypothetical protein